MRFWNALKLYSVVSLFSYVLGDNLNNLVIAANHGFMPVVTTAENCAALDLLNDGVHVCSVHSHHLIWLADIIRYQDTIYSIGDVFLSIGDKLVFGAPLALLCFGLCYFLSKMK